MPHISEPLAQGGAVPDVVPPSGGPSELPRVGRLQLAAWTLALFGLWTAVMTPATVSLALRVGQIDPGGKEGSYSLIAGVGAVVAVIANPLAGRLSDLTTSRFGRRRPWIAGGALGTFAGSALLATGHSVAALFAGWIVIQLFANAAAAALIALIADRFPAAQQGTASGLLGMTVIAGALAGTYVVKILPDSPSAIFLAPAGLAVVCIAAFLLVFPDQVLPAARRPAFHPRTFLQSFYMKPSANPDFAWTLLTLFLVAAGPTFVVTYSVYFLQDYLHIAKGDVPGTVFISVLIMNLLGLVSSPLAGVTSDRIGRRKPVFIASALLAAVGLAVLLGVKSLPVFYVGVGIVGVGNGLFQGLYVAMATATLTDPSTTARDLGLVNIATTIPQSLVPFAAPALLAVGGGGNYPVLFGTGIITALLGIPMLRKINIK
ncbi:MFS transporter [Streptomyces sp. NPDC059639]|uniref:MFS transporter n=1 Tax=Streptomyces sp. NPDC059639 TaxID=3346891 RepID=UPI003694866A